MLLNIRDFKQKLGQFWPRFFSWHQPRSQGVLFYIHPHVVREYGRGGQEPWERGCSDITPVVTSHLYHVTPNFCRGLILWMEIFFCKTRFLQYYCEILVFQLRMLCLIYWNYNSWALFINYMCPHYKCPLMQRCILTKQLTFHDAITGCPVKWHLSKDCRNSILMIFTTQVCLLLLIV